MKIKLKKKYGKEKAKEEAVQKNVVESDEAAKKQQKFYEELFKSQPEAVPQQNEIPVEAPKQNIESEKPQEKRKKVKKNKPDPFYREKQKAAEMREQQRIEMERKTEEMKEKDDKLRENLPQRRKAARKLQQCGSGGQLKMANQIEHLLGQIMKK